VNAVCSSVEQLKECVVNSRCEGYQDNSIDRFVQTFGSLCLNESRQVFLDGNRCFTSESTKGNLTRQCSEQTNTTEQVDQCTKRDQFQTCSRIVYTTHCGKRATNLILAARQQLENHPCVVSTGKSSSGNSWNFSFRITSGGATTPICGAVIAIAAFYSTVLNSMQLSTGGAI
jgi:hypothetical protein